MQDALEPLAAAAVLQGRYVVGQVLAQGEGSVVHAARDVLIGRDVAVKVFPARSAGGVDVRTQEGEARMIAGLNHPALVTLLDAGTHMTEDGESRVFLVLELVPGGDLGRRLQQGPMSVVEVGYLAWDLLGALEHIHEQGIFHGDIKPTNVLLAEARNRPPAAKLADFGMAALREQLGRPVAHLMQSDFFSPEQRRGGPVTPATDVYSLGLVLREALTGRHPGAAAALLDVPEGLAALLERMVQIDAALRPAVEEARAAVRELLVDLLGVRRPEAVDPESERLEALREYNLLDAHPDPEFDRITALAVRLFGVPVAIITVVHEHKVLLKSRQGIAVAEVDRKRGLGSPGGLHDETLVIEDVLTDPRTADLPRAADSPYRFYAGVPLITREGHNLGTLAILDEQPHVFSSDRISILEDLAAMTMHEMELRRAARRIALQALEGR
ncbi:GAF domain-containing serine/threonine-protein kinase [Amnibacterium sp. CER49]|uniref:GAF domain-containing serine/threonine-protein kinase n=1 Tax=Amnibacterium sp. CER49 TaxID=3039161 RepID=UPI00244A1F4B|nr:GAF domain-containing serine/threonine-protein kinase [Amnibacterium sp. CER49]MDH2442920.1 GAF domain-containing serine/threonine-protein kinase [Amnibacterium sp. CER49]